MFARRGILLKLYSEKNDQIPRVARWVAPHFAQNQRTLRAQLLQKLPLYCLLESFTRSNLAAGKFPQPPVLLFNGALTKKEPVVFADDRCYHLNYIVISQ